MCVSGLVMGGLSALVWMREGLPVFGGVCEGLPLCARGLPRGFPVCVRGFPVRGGPSPCVCVCVCEGLPCVSGLCARAPCPCGRCEGSLFVPGSV